MFKHIQFKRVCVKGCIVEHQPLFCASDSFWEPSLPLTYDTYGNAVPALSSVARTRSGLILDCKPKIHATILHSHKKNASHGLRSFCPDREITNSF